MPQATENHLYPLYISMTGMSASSVSSLTLWSSNLFDSVKGTYRFVLSSTVYMWMVKVKVLVASRVQVFATPWTVACQALLSMEFSRQEYQSGLPFPSPEDLPNPQTVGLLICSQPFFYILTIISVKNMENLLIEQTLEII